MTPRVRELLGYYQTESATVVSRLARLLNQGSVEIGPYVAPLMLLVLGHTRVLPVMLLSLELREELFDNNLNPIRATVGLNMRAPYSAKGYVNASLRWNKQTNTTGTESSRLTPNLRLDYRLAKNITVEAEYQKDFSTTRGPSYGDDTKSDFYRIGWRWDF